MKEKAELPILSIEDLITVLQGRGRDVEPFKHMYVDEGLNGTHIRIRNYKLKTSAEQHLTIPSANSHMYLTFENCEFNSLEIQFPYEELSIINCKLTEFHVTSAIIKNLSIIRNQNVISEVLIKDYYVQSFKSDADFQELKYVGQSGKTSLVAELSGHIGTLLLKDINNFDIHGVPVIKKCKVLNSVNSRAEGDSVTLENVYIGDKLLLKRCAPELRAVNNDGGSEYLYIDRLVIQDSLKDLSIKNIGVAPVYINFLSFVNIHIGKDQPWTLQGLILQELSFTNFRNSGTGNIIGTSGGTFKFLEQDFKKLMQQARDDKLDGSFFREACNIIDAAPLYGDLNLYSSDLGKLNFIDTDFSHFRLHYYSTKLNEIFLAGSSLPKQVYAMGPGKGKAEQQIRIANTQLKKLHEQHGDVVAANEYFANEMNAYYAILSWKSDFWEKFPLLLNKISSNHGQSWIRGLISTLLTGGLFFMAFAISIGNEPADTFNQEYREQFYKVSSFFLDFINPIHKLDTFEEITETKTFSPPSRFIDGFSRIFIAYFAYQLIQAFRKHGKSK